MIPNQPLTVLAYLPGSHHCIAQTSDGQLGRVNADSLSWMPITDAELEAAKAKYGYRPLKGISTYPDNLAAVLAGLTH